MLWLDFGNGPIQDGRLVTYLNKNCFGPYMGCFSIRVRTIYLHYLRPNNIFAGSLKSVAIAFHWNVSRWSYKSSLFGSKIFIFFKMRQKLVIFWHFFVPFKKKFISYTQVGKFQGNSNTWMCWLDEDEYYGPA